MPAIGRAALAAAVAAACASFGQAQGENLPPARSLWDVEQPMCEELLTDSPSPLASEGAIAWAHMTAYSALRSLAARHGWRYCLDEWLADHGRRNIHLLRSPGVFAEPDPLGVEWHEKHGLTYVYYCFYYDQPSRKKYPFVLDPEFTDLSLQALERGLQTCPELIWAVFSGDEQKKQLRKQVPALMETGPEEYPYIAQVAEEVKRDFGFGKWGPPESPQDKNPLRWSALYRWGLAKFRDRQHRVAEIVRRHKPEVRLISTDPTSGIHPFEYSLAAPDVDIFTQQMQPWDNNSRMITYAFAAKLVADTSGKDFWPCPHLNRMSLGISPTPENAREVYSLIALNGGTGFHFYLRDCYVGPDKGVDTYVPAYGAPERWRAMMDVYDRVQTGALPALPTDPDCALFYSNDAHQALRIGASYPCQHAYALLGPILRTWFKVVDEHTFPDATETAQQYRAVFLPVGSYLRAEAVEKLEAYVRAGGTVVCADPRAFSFDLHGTDLSDRRTALTGAALGEQVEAATCQVVENALLPDLAGTVIQFRGEPLALDATDAEVIATYPTGEAAITCAERGEGQCLYFGFSVFPDKAYGKQWRWLAEDVVLDEGWRGFFRALCEKLGIRMGRDIWRFRYPAPEEQPQPGATVCLTGNAVRWESEQPIFDADYVPPGSYSYSVPPDLIPDAAEGEIPFSEGNLTDRKDAAVPDADPSVEPYVVAWQTTEPVRITFDLADPRQVARVRLFFSGQLPATALQVSSDGERWTEGAAAEGSHVGEDILSVELAAPEGALRYLRLDLGERPPETALTVCEVEIWGAE